EPAARARLDRSLLAAVGDTFALGRAFARWELADDDRRILLVLLAAALSPRVSRLLAILGGDPSSAAISVDAVAALLAPHDHGLARVADRFVASAPLSRLALAQLTRPELPFARRGIVLAPRIVELARGTLELDATVGL